MKRPTELNITMRSVDDLNRELAECKEVIAALMHAYDLVYEKVSRHGVRVPARKFHSRLIYYALSRAQAGIERLINRIDALRENIEDELKRREFKEKPI